jgi:hypothetical protein
MGAAHDTLAWQARQTGYPPGLLAQIADAVIGEERPVEQLTDQQAAIVSDAVDTLAQAGWLADTLPDGLAHYRQQFAENWRERFWPRVLRTACLRFDNAPFYGLSPIETDPVRLARWGPAPDWGAGEQAAGGHRVAA